VSFMMAAVGRRSLSGAHCGTRGRCAGERRFRDGQLANSVLFELYDGIASLAGATEVRKLLVTRALQYLDSLSREAAGDTSLQMELAAAYTRVGDVQATPDSPNLGDTPGALRVTGARAKSWRLFSPATRSARMPAAALATAVPDRQRRPPVRGHGVWRWPAPRRPHDVGSAARQSPAGESPVADWLTPISGLRMCFRSTTKRSIENLNKSPRVLSSAVGRSP